MKKILMYLVLPAAALLPGAQASAQNLGDAIGSVAREMLNREIDTRNFSQAQQINTVEAYQNYLRNAPQGSYRMEAERAIGRLAPAPTPIPQPQIQVPQPQISAELQVENALGLSRAQRTQVQTRLTALGYNTRGADGAWGANTRTAIRAWQGANNLPATGYITGAQLDLISAQAARLPPATPAVPPNTTPNAQAGSEATERAIGLSLSERREVQLRLSLLGHETGGTAGTFGTSTRNAIRAWQRSQGEAQSGYLTDNQLRALQRQTGG